MEDIKKKETADQRPKGQDGFEDGIEGLFWGWFNNHMAMILLAIECRRIRETRSMIRIELFLNDIEHHFIESDVPKQVRDAFRWIKRYFRVYPAVTIRQSEKAARMLGTIYAAVESKQRPSFVRQNLDEEKSAVCMLKESKF